MVIKKIYSLYIYFGFFGVFFYKKTINIIIIMAFESNYSYVIVVVVQNLEINNNELQNVERDLQAKSLVC